MGHGNVVIETGGILPKFNALQCL